jgi:hypothetical protein
VELRMLLDLEKQNSKNGNDRYGDTDSPIPQALPLGHSLQTASKCLIRQKQIQQFHAYSLLACPPL